MSDTGKRLCFSRFRKININIIDDANERPLTIRTANFDTRVPVRYILRYERCRTRLNLRKAERITGDTDRDGCSLLGDE